MKKGIVVLKFGGTSVASKACWDTIASIVRERLDSGLTPFVVCSALAGVSNSLEKALREAMAGSHGETLEKIRKMHMDLAEALGVSGDAVSGYLEELAGFLKGAELTGEVSPRLKARVMASGELMSTALGAAYLRKKGLDAEWLDARRFLKSVDICGSHERNMLSASCIYERDEELISFCSGREGASLVTQGFIAGGPSGDTVLLGRGGSDVSASYFAAKLSAVRCEIWTDVPGMYTADPRQIPSARLIKALDYDEAQEIASLGAKVLHPRCLSPVKKFNIPLQIYCLAHPSMQGTVVTNSALQTEACVKAIASKKGITLISMESVEMWQQVGFLADIFACFKRHGMSVDLVSTSETNVTVTLDQTTNVLTEGSLRSLIDDLNTFCSARVVDFCATVSILGRNIRSIIPQLGQALEVFEEQRIYLISQAANDLNITFVVDEDQAERLTKRLHEQLFRPYGDKDLLGPSWQDVFCKDRKRTVALPNTWWVSRRQELLKIAERKCPVYVYDEATIERMIANVRSIRSVDRVFYSMKANRNDSVLKKFFKAGLGFECVSADEVAYLFRLFPKLEPGRVMFTPNFASRSEYEYGLRTGVNVTLDNIYPVRQWPQLFKGRDVFLRIDPGQGHGHHKYVHTAGIRSKFGISGEQFIEARQAVDKAGINVIGLHAHVGSNILTPDVWGETALFLVKVADMFRNVRYLDLGGGLGVVEKQGRQEFDINALDLVLSDVRTAHPGYELWIEPGRYLVAEAGVLLARVTQTKKKGDCNYVGLETGMNSLIRPALYGAHHEIINLSKSGRPACLVANVVGPICESGDILGYDRPMPVPDEGDVMLIATAGAYGRVMSSEYNLRAPAGEHFLRKR